MSEAELPEAWKPKAKQARRLGSSEIGAVWALYNPDVIYLAKQKTAADVWLRLFRGIEWMGNARTDRGLECEPLLAQTYLEAVGEWWRPVPWGESWVVGRPECDWASCSPDAFAGDNLIVELKTQHWRSMGQWGPSGTDLVPDSYNTQCQWLLWCTQREAAHVVVAFGEDVKGEPFAIQDTRLYEVAADPGLQETLRQVGERFTNEFVRTGSAPPVKPNHHRRDWKRVLHGIGRDPKDPAFIDLNDFFKRQRDAALVAGVVSDEGGAGSEEQRE